MHIEWCLDLAWYNRLPLSASWLKDVCGASCHSRLTCVQEASVLKTQGVADISAVHLKARQKLG